MTDASNSHYLEYIETQREHSYKLKFCKICPHSAGTIIDQMRYINPEALTLVAFLPDDVKSKFGNVINEIKKLDDRFNEVINLHTTLLRLFPTKSHKLNSHFESIVKNKVSEFFKKELSAGYHYTFKLEFSLIRPGTWHGLNNIPIPEASNGTVVAIGELTSVGNKKFADLATNLELYLKSELGSIYRQDYTRKFSNIWCTLGYFNCDDFDIDSNFVDTFNEWNPLDKSMSNVTVSELQMVKYHLKSLQYYQSILKIPQDL